VGRSDGLTWSLLCVGRGGGGRLDSTCKQKIILHLISYKDIILTLMLHLTDLGVSPEVEHLAQLAGVVPVMPAHQLPVTQVVHLSHRNRLRFGCASPIQGRSSEAWSFACMPSPLMPRTPASRNPGGTPVTPEPLLRFGCASPILPSLSSVAFRKPGRTPAHRNHY
jgi:hypothetical protein